MLHSLRNSASSSELLHERAMMRFYQAAEAEEAELEKKRKLSEKRNSVDIPKIQINSLDDANIVGLERKHSLRRRLSAGGISHWQAMETQRRQSLRTPKELAEELLQSKLQKFSPPEKRELMMLRQRSESEEKEEIEFEKVRKKMQDKVKFEKKVIKVADMEKWSDDYEESTEEETESSEDERRNSQTIHHYDLTDEEEDTYHPSAVVNNDNEPFEILTKRKNLPDPNFVPKPILKKKDYEDIKLVETIAVPVKDKKKQRSHSPMPADVMQRERSHSLVEQLIDPITEKMFGKKQDKKKETNSRPRSFSLIPNKGGEKCPSLEKIKEEDKVSPTHNLKIAAELTGITAASIVIPERLLNKKKDNEEAKVVIDHYGDILKNYSQKKKLNKETAKSYTETETVYTVTEAVEPSIESLSQNVEIIDVIPPKPNVIKEPHNTFEEKKVYSRSAITNDEQKDCEPLNEKKRDFNKSPKKSRRTPSQSPGRRNHSRRSASKSPSKNENYLKMGSEKRRGKTSPSPMRHPQRNVSQSPATSRRNSSKSPSPVNSKTYEYSRHRPLLKEIMTQTSVGLESFSAESRTSTPTGRSSKQEELIARAEIKVKSVIDYITDLTMFLVACWLYVFKNELLAIPFLLIMIYRQLTSEIKRRIPNWLVKRFSKKKV